MGSLIGTEWDNNIEYCFGYERINELSEMIENGEFTVRESKIPNKLERIETIIHNHKTLLGQEVFILTLWRYKIPISEYQETSLIFYHEFIILELLIDHRETLYCSIEKNSVKIIIFYNKTFQSVRDYMPEKPGENKRRWTLEKWEPIKREEFELMYSYFDFIKDMYDSELHNEKYNLLTSNCQQFCKNITKYLIQFKIN